MYPLAKDALYRPKTCSLHQALSFGSSVGLRKVVLVQPSIYGNDNRCMLDALKILGTERARAVVASAPQALAPETLKEWNALGVRGVRVNFSSVGKSASAGELKQLLHRYADDCRPLNWIIQVYMPMEMMEILEPIVPELGVRVCIDHMGHPRLEQMRSTGSPYEMLGFRAMVNMLKSGNVFVKLSAPYRLSREPDYKDLEPVAQEILRVAGKTAVVFATDWPHTRFEGLDIRPWIEAVLNRCNGDDLLTDRVFRANAEALWEGK